MDPVVAVRVQFSWIWSLVRSGDGGGQLVRSRGAGVGR
jgi:hypothetical protein